MTKTIGNTTFLLLGIAILLFFGACTRTHTPVGLDSAVKIFSDNPQNPIFGQNSDWTRLGSSRSVNIKSVYKGAIPVLQISSAYANAAFLRRVDAQLLATPFLFWSWSVIDGPPIHPVRLIIGFSDTGQSNDRIDDNRTIFSSQKLPAFSRTLTLVWGASALKRGTLTIKPNQKGQKPGARYIVRGGRENQHRWWNENLDLSHLHTLAWPLVDMSQSRIVFTGISTAGGAVPGTMQIAQIKLSR